MWTYSKLPWDARARALLHGRLEALDSLEREALVVRLANTLELHLDLAALYCSNAGVRRRAIEREGALIVNMAERLDVSRARGRYEAGVPGDARWHGAARAAPQERPDARLPP